MGTASAPVTVADALSSFAVAYSGTGYQLNRSDLTLVDEAGKPLGSDNARTCRAHTGHRHGVVRRQRCLRFRQRPTCLLCA